MKVTDVKIRKLFSEGRLKAIVSVTIDGKLAVHDLKVIDNTHLFVAFPSRKDENGMFRDIVHPTDTQSRILIEGAVLKEYAKAISQTA